MRNYWLTAYFKKSKATDKSMQIEDSVTFAYKIQGSQQKQGSYEKRGVVLSF